MPTQQNISLPAQRSITVTQAQSGARISLQSSQELIVRLPTQPASKVDWALADLQFGVLNLISTKFELAPRDASGDDTSGVTTWRFKPHGPGQVKLSFELRRPRSLQPPVQTIAYDVTVE